MAVGSEWVGRRCANITAPMPVAGRKEDPLAVLEANPREMVQEMKMVFFLAEYETTAIAEGHSDLSTHIGRR